MHTDDTLHLLEEATQDLANNLRAFIDNVCAKIQTEELAAEVEAREKREARRAEKKEIERQVRAAATDVPCLSLLTVFYPR
jgi:hypothetical protein